MGILEYLLGPPDRDPDDAQPPPSKGGAGPDVDEGRPKTQTEKELGRVQGQHDPDTDSSKEEGEQGLLERERRNINREDDPHFDPTDKTSGGKISGADQAPNHEVKRTGRSQTSK